MNFNFLQSLEHMSSVVIASKLLHECTVAKLLLEEQDPPRAFPCPYRVRHAYWQLVEETVIKKLALLPSKLAQRVTYFLRRLHNYRQIWIVEHEYLNIHVEYIEHINLLIWKTNGTIDQMKTAQKIVRIEAVDLKSKFIVACTYFLEEEILNLWCRVRETNFGKALRSKKSAFPKGSNSVVRFWVKFLEEGAVISWRKMAEEYFRNLTIRPRDSFIRLMPIFRYLSPDIRKNYIRHFKLGQTQHDDLRRCLFELDGREIAELLDSSCIEVLKLFLEWPFQSLFINMARNLFSRLANKDFELLVEFIVKINIVYCYREFDYFELFQEFWHASPNSFKEHMKTRKSFFGLIQKIVKCDSLAEFGEQKYRRETINQRNSAFPSAS